MGALVKATTFPWALSTGSCESPSPPAVAFLFTLTRVVTLVVRFRVNVPNKRSSWQRDKIVRIALKHPDVSVGANPWIDRITGAVARSVGAHAHYRHHRYAIVAVNILRAVDRVV